MLTNPQKTTDLFILTTEIFNEKLLFWYNKLQDISKFIKQEVFKVF